MLEKLLRRAPTEIRYNACRQRSATMTNATGPLDPREPGQGCSVAHRVAPLALSALTMAPRLTAQYGYPLRATAFGAATTEMMAPAKAKIAPQWAWLTSRGLFMPSMIGGAHWESESADRLLVRL
jgi:hypothetical protein